jgi:hypothetical protein
MILLLLACTAGPGAETNAADTAPPDTGTACPLLPADTRLVLADGCADGLCGGTWYADAVATAGEPDACTTAGLTATCTWGDLAMDFPDCDGDGAPDPDATACDLFHQSITLSGGWDGASAEGLGLGVSAACWELTLGAPPAQGWVYGENPWITVTITPNVGAVTTVTLAWAFDE